MSEGNPLDVEGNIFRETLRRLAREDATVVLREGLEIMDRFGLDVVIRCDGKEYDVETLPPAIQQEMSEHFRQHDAAIKHLADSKYCDPATNPMIKVNPDR